ncbi:hypothetical protein LINGRAHAP2_LOCUS3298, partial [Linum grandiflorum]
EIDEVLACFGEGYFVGLFVYVKLQRELGFRGCGGRHFCSVLLCLLPEGKWKGLNLSWLLPCWPMEPNGFVQKNHIGKEHTGVHGSVDISRPSGTGTCIRKEKQKT